MKKNSIKILVIALLLFGFNCAAGAATFDVTTTGIVASEGIKDTNGNLLTVPSGVILIWSGAIANIPPGWALCNGSNGTPNLTDRFVIHADADTGGTRNAGTTGGSHMMIDHTHTYSLTAANHNHSIQSNKGGGDNWVASDDPLMGSTGYTTIFIDYTNNTGPLAVSGTIGQNSAAGSTPTIPKYYALAYIMKL
jgi:hypothetical protein